MFEDLQARVPKISENWQNMRSMWQTEQQQRNALEAELARMRSMIGQPLHTPPPPASNYGGPGFVTPGLNLPAAPQPMPGAPPNGGAPPVPAQAPVLPAPGTTDAATLQAARDYLRNEYGQEYVDANEKIVAHLAGQMTQAVSQQIQQLYGPELQSIKSHLQSFQQREVQQQNTQFDAEVKAQGHPDWAEVLTKPDFKQFLMEHPMGPMWYGAVFPGDGQASGTSGEHTYILNEYKNSRPELKAQLEQEAEKKRRQEAAAASSQGYVQSMPPGLPDDAPVLLLSQVQHQAQQLMTKPREYTEFIKTVDAARAAGRLYDDINASAGHQMPAVP